MSSETEEAPASVQQAAAPSTAHGGPRRYATWGRKMLRDLACLFLCLVFGAVRISPAVAGANTETLSPHTKIKSVAIISAIGETFMFEHVRDAPFEWFSPSEASFLEISDWGLDDLVVREATATLSQRFKIVPVNYDEADFDTWTWYNLVRHLRELPPPDEDVDAYVVILRDWRGDDIGNSVHQVAGLGLYRRDVRNGSPRVGVFASYRVAIIDARTDDILVSRPALTPAGKLPWLRVEPSIWPKTQNDLTNVQTKVLQDDVRTLSEETLDFNLRKMFPPSARLRNPKSRMAGK